MLRVMGMPVCYRRCHNGLSLFWAEDAASKLARQATEGLALRDEHSDSVSVTYLRSVYRRVLVGDLGRLLDDGARLAAMGGFLGLLNKQAVIAE